MNREWLTFLEDRRLVPADYAAELGRPPDRLTERDRRVFGAVPVRDTVREQRIGAWVAFYRIASQAGVPVVGEVRIFPYEPHPRRRHGLWSGEVLGSAATVPPGGLTARVLRRVPLDLRRISAEVLHLRREPENSPFRWGLETRNFQAVPQRPRRGAGGRPSTPPEMLARVAVLYERAWTRRVSPLQTIAAALGVPPSTARGLVARSRVQGFLHPPKVKQGQTHGRATPKARALWPEHRKKAANRKRADKGQK